MRRAGTGLVLAALLALAGCSGLPAAVVKGALGGGPNVAANVQAGRTNAQVLGQAQVADQRLIRPQARQIEQSAGETGLRAERVERVTVQREAPPWLWFLVIAGWVLPSPGEIARQIGGLFNRRRADADG